MAEVFIYEPHPSLERKFVPKLLEQITAKGGKAYILCCDEAQVKSYDELLWSYEQLSFLPHVTSDDAVANATPIVLGAKLENYDDKNVLICLQAVQHDVPANFEKIIYIKGQHFNESLFQGIANISRFKQAANGSWGKA